MELTEIFMMPIRAVTDLVTTSWYTSNIRNIKELVQDPATQNVSPYEPVMEVIIGSATLDVQKRDGKQTVAPTFVRVWMDAECVGDTSIYLDRDTARPVWNQRFLLIPRASVSTRFEVLEANDPTRVRGFCALGTEGLWRSAQNAKYSLDVPLLSNSKPVGTLLIHIRMWDGLSIQDTQWWPEMNDRASRMEPRQDPPPTPPSSPMVTQPMPILLAQPQYAVQPILLPARQVQTVPQFISLPVRPQMIATRPPVVSVPQPVVFKSLPVVMAPPVIMPPVQVSGVNPMATQPLNEEFDLVTVFPDGGMAVRPFGDKTAAAASGLPVVRSPVAQGVQ